jgi:hypothetical protein
MCAGSMPNFATSPAFVDPATKCFAIAASFVKSWNALLGSLARKTAAVTGTE